VGKKWPEGASFLHEDLSVHEKNQLCDSARHTIEVVTDEQKNFSTQHSQAQTHPRIS
jgi:hypothetical protein